MSHQVNGEAEGRKTVQSVVRALTLLEALADKGIPTSITDLAASVNLQLSTVHRLLNTLICQGFVEQDPQTVKYKLTMKLFQIGNSALYNIDIRSIARPYLQELVQSCNETANLAIMDQGEVVYIDQIESNNMIIVKMFAKVGSRGPAHCTGSGKVLLASLGDEEVMELITARPLQQFTNETITDPNHLHKELKRVRNDGYALDMGERDEGVRCISAPVFNHEGRIAAAISVSGPSSRLTTYKLNNELIPLVKETADKLSRGLGYRC